MSGISSNLSMYSPSFLQAQQDIHKNKRTPESTWQHSTASTTPMNLLATTWHTCPRPEMHRPHQDFQEKRPSLHNLVNTELQHLASPDPQCEGCRVGVCSDVFVPNDLPTLYVARLTIQDKHIIQVQ